MKYSELPAMRLSDFDFILPPELIAQNPASPRDSARMLVFNRTTGEIRHSFVRDIGQFLPKNTQIVANNSRVRKCRLFGICNKKLVEVVVLECISEETYQCLIGGKKIKSGDLIQFCTSKTNQVVIPVNARVVEVSENSSLNTFTLNFESSLPIEDVFKQYGIMPLPPYITESTATDDQYQTTFAKIVGSAAAPTAGLHFTTSLIESLQKNNTWHEVTLHVGLGTFLPLRDEHIEKNHLHSELTEISQDVADRLTTAKKDHQPILAIGTTSTRVLESHTLDAKILSGTRETNIFMYPGYTFKSTDLLFTNFHLPKSSLLLLVAAFLGSTDNSELKMISTFQSIYKEAIRNHYKFFSFGDAMLII